MESIDLFRLQLESLDADDDLLETLQNHLLLNQKNLLKAVRSGVSAYDYMLCV